MNGVHHIQGNLQSILMLVSWVKEQFARHRPSDEVYMNSPVHERALVINMTRYLLFHRR